MALSVTISLDSVCDGGGHTFLSVSEDGGQARVRSFHTENLRQQLTADDKLLLVELLVRAKVGNLTRAQARTALQNGFTVTIS